MFVLLIDINNETYLNYNGLEKFFIIKETLKQLKSNNRKIQKAIEKALLIFRKYFVTLTIIIESLEDYCEKNTLIKAAFNISDIKLIIALKRWLI